MDVQQLVSEFLSSEHGEQATQALADQWAAPRTRSRCWNRRRRRRTPICHMEQQGAGVLGDNPGKSFLAGFAAGLARGDGFFQSLEEGGEGILTGRVTEAIGARVGIDPATASTLAAAAMPYGVAFRKQRAGRGRREAHAGWAGPGSRLPAKWPRVPPFVLPYLVPRPEESHNKV